MNPANPASQSGKRHAGSELPCAKCGHVNPPGSNTCEQCQAHLWVVCHHCGYRNRRVDPRCVECGFRLHRSLWRRLSKKFFPNRKIAAWQIVLLLIAVWVAYKLIVFFAEYRVPAPEE